jgi:protein regulator of cytokinesis 1
VLGEDFIAIVNEVHPGLHETADPGKPTSISDSTLASLSQVVAMLTSEKTKRAAMVATPASSISHSHPCFLAAIWLICQTA